MIAVAFPGGIAYISTRSTKIATQEQRDTGLGVRYQQLVANLCHLLVAHLLVLWGVVRAFLTLQMLGENLETAPCDCARQQHRPLPRPPPDTAAGPALNWV